MAPSKPPATRRRHTNLKLGCLNCKRKKIRCDENLPQCDNCLRAKKELCSYLKLSQSDINRIRLTHLLRNSQNKLLSRDYRLPISTNQYFGAGAEKLETRTAAPNTLEFQFELCDFDKPFPKVPYVAIQFHNTFMDVFDNEYTRELTRSSSVASGEDIAPRGLPHSRSVHTRFRKLDYGKCLLDIPLMKQLLCLMTFVRNFKGSEPYLPLFVEAYLVLGRTLILCRMKQNCQLNPHAYDQRLVAQQEARVHHDCSLLMTSLQFHINQQNDSVRTRNLSKSQLRFQQTVVSYASWCCTASLLFLNFPRHMVVRSISDRCLMFSEYLAIEGPETEDLNPMVKTMSDYIRYSLLYIHIPLYEPAFLYEMRSNLAMLEHMFTNGSMVFADEKSRELYRRVGFHYQNLVSFMDNFVLNVAYASRNELMVTTYPPKLVFDALRRWWAICPTDLMSGGLVSECPGFLDDLRNTIYLYYQALSMALESVWPAGKYLFTIGFDWMSQNWHGPAQIFEPSWELYRTDHILPDRKLADFLWRHNIYATRLASFFRKRIQLYRENTIYRAPFAEGLPNLRYSLRKIKNALELPVRSFNTLTIKPHNFARKIHSHYDLLLKDASVCAIYTRDAAGMDVAGCNEPFDLFNLAQPIKINPQSSFCLNDYYPDENTSGNVENTLDSKILKRYFDDRCTMLEDMK